MLLFYGKEDSHSKSVTATSTVVLTLSGTIARTIVTAYFMINPDQKTFRAGAGLLTEICNL